MGKSVRKDSDSFVTNNAFDDFNNKLKDGSGAVVNGKKVQVKKDSETMPTTPGDAFDQFNQQLKKKDDPLVSSPVSAPKESQGASTFLYNGKYTTPAHINTGDATTFFSNDFLKSAPTGEFEPVKVFPQIDANGQPVVDEAATQNRMQQILSDPKQLSAYTFKRVNTLQDEIKQMESIRDGLVRKRQSFRGGELEEPKAGERTKGVYMISDPDYFDKLNSKIDNLKNTVTEFKDNASEVVGQTLIKQHLASGKKSIGNPRELGRNIVRYSDEKTDATFNALETVKRDIGPSPNADLEMAGIHAWKKYLNDNPADPNATYLQRDVEEWERSFDQRNPELTAARVKHKIGAYLHKKSGSSIFRNHPSVSEIEEAAINSNLTPSEMQVYKNFVLPIEKKNIGTDIPTSGFVLKAGEAWETGIKGLSNIFRKDVDRIYEGLNEETNTAYDEAGEFGRDKADYVRLKHKEKSKEGITPEEKKKINSLEQYVDVRNWYDKFWDGSGDLTGQVMYQATLGRLTGGLGNVVSKVPVLGKLANTAAATMKGKDAANLMVSSFLTSYDNHAKEAALLLPNKEDAFQRRLYAFTMSGVEGLSERIFNDTKVLDAFKKSISPDVLKLTQRISQKEITKEAAMTRLQGIVQNKMKPFAKEFLKAEFQEGTEEAVVDIAQGVAESVFGGKEFDADATISNASNTFLTTMAYSPFVSTLAATKDVRAGAFGKSGFYKMASNPEIYKREINNQVDQGAITQQEADDKIKIINTSSKILSEIPDTRSSEAKGKPGPKDLDYPERVNYLVHRLNEAVLQEQADNTSDEVVKADLTKQIERSKKIREGIYNGDIVSGNNMEEIALDDKTATDLDITPVANVEDDALPYGVDKKKFLERNKTKDIAEIDNKINNLDQDATDYEEQKQVLEDEKQIIIDEYNDLLNPKTKADESIEQRREQTPEKQTGSASGSGQNIGQQNGLGEQAVQQSESSAEELSEEPGETEMTVPPGFTPDQFNKLPAGVQTKLLDKAKAKAAAAKQPATAPVEETTTTRVLKIDAKTYETLPVEERKTKMVEDLGFADYESMTSDDADTKNVYVLADTNEKGERMSMIADLDYALEQGDMTEAQFIFNSLEKRAAPYKALVENVEKLKPSFQKMANDNPSEFLKFVAQQSNNVNAAGEFVTNTDSRESAKKNFAPEIIDAANETFPQYKAIAVKKETTTAEPTQPATPTTTESVTTTEPASSVTFQPLESISTDTKKFQPRSAAYSQESVDKIVNDFDNDVLDPVRYWRNPEDGKDYIVSGHSRLQAHKLLAELPNTDERKLRAIQKGFQPGFVKAEPIANASTFEQAEQIAFRSNDRGTANKDHEKAAYLRKLRENGQPKSSIIEQAKNDYGKNWRYIFALSYLNPNGKIIDTLKQFDGSTDKDTQNKVERAAQWVGVTRERLGNQISNAQENEMFDFLMDKGRSTKLDRENDFVSLIQNMTGRFDYNANEPLNLTRIKNKSTSEFHYDTEEQEIKTDIKEKQKDLDGINDRLNNPLNPSYINPKSSDYNDVLRVAEQRKSVINTELTALRKDLMELQQNKGKLISEGVSQPSLFDLNNLTPTEQTELNDVLAEDGITIENIQEYEENLSRPEEDAETDIPDGQQAEIFPSTVQESPNEPSASAEQDQSSEAIQGRESASAAVTEPVDPIEAEKKAKLEAAKKAFKDSLRKSRGQANVSIVPIDPEVIANGVKLMAAYADLGIYKFKQIIQDIAESFGPDYLDAENVNALKGVYSYYRSNLPKEERAEFDNEDAVDDFIENDLKAYDSAPADVERQLQMFANEMEASGDKEGADYYEGELNNFKNNPYQYWADQYLSSYQTDPESDAVDEALNYLRREISYERKFLVNKENPADIININVPLHEKEQLTYRRGSNIDYRGEVADIFENYVPLNDERYRVRKITDFAVGDYYMDYATFFPQKIINIKGNSAIVESPLGVQSDEFVGDDARYLPVTEQEFINKREEYARSTTSDLESDSTRRDIGDAMGQEDVSIEQRRDDIDDGGTSEEIIQPIRTPGSPGLLPFDANITRVDSDTAIPIEERLAGLETYPAGDGDSGRGGDVDDSGVSFEAGTSESIEGAAGEITGLDIERKIEAQKAAEGIPVKDIDFENIKATLPFLLPGQHNDVYKAEQRLIGQNDNPNELYGKAILFTNGTGTGKTLTGWGVAKRMIKRGKINGLIVVPTDVKAKDWLFEGKEYMGIDAEQLSDTKDAGKEGVPSVTTYANLRENPYIQLRQFDWVIYDEAHKINSNATGKITSAELAHNKVTASPRIAREKAKLYMNYDSRMAQLSNEKHEAYKNNQDFDNNRIKMLEEELKLETIRQFQKTKVIFLSATPFSYHDSLTLADGYLFTIRESFEPKYDSNSYNQFYIQNFGYRIRYNKLTKPESGVDVDLLERQFTEGLKNKGLVVSRKLDVQQDYSREFVTIDSEIGAKIDEGIAILSNRDNFELLPMFIHRRFNFLYLNQLMEGFKAKWAVNRIKEHLAMGRKVVVSHTYIDNEPGNPFDFDAADLLNPNDENYSRLRDEIQSFREEYPEYLNLRISNLESPINTLQKEFGDKVVLFNGRVPKKDRAANKKLFNDDNSGVDIFVVQMDAGKEGISLHDRTGKHQRALLNLGLPYKPTDAIQIEGRIYRTGQMSDAVIEYPVLNLSFERIAYASKIKDRVRTAENLALGEEARNMEVAFKEGYINAAQTPVSAEQGKGGKKEDSRLDNTTEFQKSLTYYYKRGKRTAADKRNVQGDYYATPEPLGMKMVEWLNLVPNERGLEPSSGHGAIARFFPRTTKNVFIEPNNELRSETAINAIGETKAGDFEDLNIINKFDGIAMNPPFGRGGKLAMEHLEKAMKHLHDGGRIVALVPTGQMDNRITDWQDSKESKGFYVQARIKLPSSVFERAGTKVGTQILIIDKVLDNKVAQKLPQQRNIDLTYAETIKEFFNEIEDLSFAGRIEPGKYAVEEFAPEENSSAPSTASESAPVEGVSQQNLKKSDIVEVVTGFHAKEQRPTYVLKLKKKISSDEFDQIRKLTSELGGYYSAFKGSGAVPGFQFPSMELAQKAFAAVTGTEADEAQKMSIADRIRTWKITNTGRNLYTTIVPGGPQIWNAAVELVALGVEAGESLTDAFRKGYNYIEQNWEKKWNKTLYNKEMLYAIKGKGLMQYDLSPSQKMQADDIINRIQQTGKLLREINAIRADFDFAKSQLTDPEDIQEVEDGYNEFERYIFDQLSANELERNTNFTLELEDQTYWQRVQANWQNRFLRMEQVQKEIEKAGITIDEKNDMVNRADRWQSIAAAKTQDILNEVGLSDVDVFIWKGRQKLNDSLFDRMAKDGVDYRNFNLFMYAKHAPERNAHNAKLRRENFTKKIAQIETDIAKYEATMAASPSSIVQGLITRKKNELAQYEQYEAAYNDPTSNKNFVKLLEGKIDRRYILMDDGGSGMTNEQAQAIIDEVEKDGDTQKFEKYETLVREKIIKKSLDLQLEYGLIDPENHVYLSEYYQNYVPLSVDETLIADGSSFTDSKMPGAKIYRSKGASQYDFENRINPVTQSVIKLQAVIYEGEQNMYKKTVAETIKSAPDTQIWQLRPATYAPIKDKQGKVVGLDEIEIPNTDKKFKSGYANGIPYLEDGVKKYLIINDEALYEAMTGAKVKNAIPILSKVNSFLRSLYTVYNPAFTITNLFRDLETAGIMMSATQKSGIGGEYRKNLLQIGSIIKGTYKELGGANETYWQQKAKEYRDSGGNMSWFQMETSQEMIKDIEGAYEKYQKTGTFEAGKNVAVKVADYVNRANTAIENATRLAVYDALQKQGVPQYKAVEVARNATVNFQKKGNFGPMADSAYLFFNASVQGTTNVLKSLLTTRKGRMMAGGIVMAGMMANVYNRFMGDCGEGSDPADCYDNIPLYERERNILLKNPGGKGFVKIPLAYGFNVFYHLGDQLGDMMDGKFNLLHTAADVMKVALNAFNPAGGSDQPVLQQISPTVTDPIVQYYTNRDAFGRPIYSDFPFDRRPESAKGFSSDSRVSQNFAQWMNTQTGGNEKIKGAIDVAPGTLDFIFETFTGGLGQFTTQTVNSIWDAADPKTDVELRGVPVVNRFYTIPKERSNKQMIYNRVDQSYNTIFSEEKVNEFKKEVDKAVRLGEMDADRGSAQKNTLERNQFRLSNPDVFIIVDRSKNEVLSESEIENFKETMNEMVESGQIKKQWASSFKAEVTKNQNKLK